MDKYNKPPLGCLPKNLFYEMRLNDLKEAIHRYMEEPVRSQHMITSMEKWIKEIHFIINNDLCEIEKEYAEPENINSINYNKIDEPWNSTYKRSYMYTFELTDNEDDKLIRFLKENNMDYEDYNEKCYK